MADCDVASAAPHGVDRSVAARVDACPADHAFAGPRLDDRGTCQLRPDAQWRDFWAGVGQGVALLFDVIGSDYFWLPDDFLPTSFGSREPR